MATDEEEPRVSLRLFKWCKDTRYNNGIRVGNYNRYRRYCKRRLSSVRKVVNMKQGRKRYTRKVLTPELTKTSKHLEIPLLNAERAWAYSMEIQDIIQQMPKGEGLAKRRHMVKRIKRAVDNATMLNNLCDKRGDILTQVEAYTYLNIMKGAKLFHKYEFKESFTSWIVAKVALETLSKLNLGSASYYREKIQDLERRLTECGHGLAINHGEDACKLAELEGEKIAKTYCDPRREKFLSMPRPEGTEAEETEQSSFTWQGDVYAIPIKELNEVLEKLELTKAAASEETSREKLLKTQLKAMFVCKRGIELLQKDLAQIESGGTAHKDITEPLYALRAKLDHELMTLRINRNCNLASQWRGINEEQKKKRKKNLRPANAFVYLYQKQLDLSLKMKQLTQTLCPVWNALRAFYLALHFFDTESYAKAAVLYAHCESLFATAEAKAQNWPSEIPSQIDLVKNFRMEARRCEVVSHAHTILQLHGHGMDTEDTKEEENPRSLLERLNEYDAGDPKRDYDLTDLMYISKQVKPIIPKPSVFDNTYNYFLDYPDLSYREKKGKSFFGGLFQ